MNVTDLLNVFSSLPPSTEEGEYYIQEIEENLLLAKSNLNELCALMKYPSEATLPATRVTRGLELRFHTQTSFLLNGKETHANWAIIRCRDASYNELFAVLVQGISHALDAGELETPYQLVEYIAEWQQLLSSRKTLTKSEYIGLWGELYVLSQASDMQIAVERWKGPDRKKFDFSHLGLEVEVKTSLKGNAHMFSLEQLQQSPSGAKRYIFSLHVQEDLGGGTTVTDLVALIRNALPSRVDFELKLLSVGYAEPMEQETPYSLYSSKLVDVKEAPKVTQFDVGVSTVTFESDLSFCEEVPNPMETIATVLG